MSYLFSHNPPFFACAIISMQMSTSSDYYLAHVLYTVNSIPDIRILEGGVHKRRGQVEEEGAGISRMRPAH